MLINSIINPRNNLVTKCAEHEADMIAAAGLEPMLKVQDVLLSC